MNVHLIFSNELELMKRSGNWSLKSDHLDARVNGFTMTFWMQTVGFEYLETERFCISVTSFSF